MTPIELSAHMRDVADDIIDDADLLRANGQHSRAKYTRKLARQMSDLSYSLAGWSLMRDAEQPGTQLELLNPSEAA